MCKFESFRSKRNFILAGRIALLTLALLFNFGFDSSNCFAEDRFSITASNLPQSGLTASFAVGDFNSDSLPDVAIVVKGLGTAELHLYQNLGKLQFKEILGALPSAEPALGDIQWVDVDGDHNLDLVVPRIPDPKVAPPYLSAFKNNADHSFTAVNLNIKSGIAHPKMAWADFNQDGKIDVALAGEGGFSVYFQNSDGTFSNSAVGVEVAGATHVYAEDFDKDGYPDLLVTGSAAALLHNEKNGKFLKRELNFGNYSSLEAAAWVDLNSDGFKDFVVSGSNFSIGTGYVRFSRVFMNRVNSFEMGDASGIPQQIPIVIRVADYDADAKPELLYAGADGGDLQLVEAQSEKSYSNILMDSPPTSVLDAAMVDLDQDGALDILISGSGLALYKLKGSGQPDPHITDTAAPVLAQLRAVRVSGKLKISYQVSDKSGSSAESFTVYARKKVLAAKTLPSKSVPILGVKRASIPLKSGARTVKVCVTSVDPSGNTSAPLCVMAKK